MEDRYDEWQDVSTKPGRSGRRKGRNAPPAKKTRDANIDWFPEDVLDSFDDEEDLDIDRDWEKYFQGEDDSE